MGAEANTAGWDGVCPASVIADLVTDRIFVIDDRHRVVLANRAFLSAFVAGAQTPLGGRSFGELVECRHAEGAGGCGGAAACAGCGWFLAVEAGAREGAGSQECRILKRSGEAFDFAVAVRPAGSGGLWVCGLQDRFAAKRLRVLERAFFHDVTNLAAGIRGLCELAADPDNGPDEELRPLIHDSANKLVDEIERLRTLRVAENGDLRLWRDRVEPGAVLQAVAERFQEDAAARHVEVVVDGGALTPALETDKALLILVIGELARNAIEASVRGDRVTLTCSGEQGRVVFSIHNPAVLDERVRLHVFERSFTTREPGRGVGAYRAKLLAERYLKGTVGFVSQAPEGTTFRAVFPLAVSGSET